MTTPAPVDDLLVPGLFRHASGGLGGITGYRPVAGFASALSIVTGDPPILVRNMATGDALTQDRGRRWQDVMSDTGSASVELPIDDPQLGDVDDGTMLRMELNGAPVFPWVVERISRKEVADGELVAQVADLSGRGLLAELDWTRVYPDIGAELPERLKPPAQQTRVFNFSASSGINDSTWPQADDTPPRYGRWDGLWALPQGWPDRRALWVWDRDTTAGAPIGTAYFRRVFGMPNGPQTVQVWATADDDYQLWLNGIPILNVEGYYKPGEAQHVELELGDHFHLLAASARNFQGPAGLMVTIVPVIAGGLVGTPLVRTDQSWKVLAYTPQPVWTVGKVLRVLSDESLFRGEMVGWSLAFDDVNDSNGNAWPPVEDFTVPVGCTYLDVLKQMTEQHIDFGCSRAGRILSAYRIGEMGTSVTSAFTRGLYIEELTVEQGA